jgi:putative endonuclease
MFYVYVLYSKKYDKTYTGYTSNLEQRLLSHNELSSKDWTKRYRPWHVAYFETFPTKSEAMKREKHFKTGIGREFINEKIKEFLKE